MTISGLISWLLRGSDEQFLSVDWLKNNERMHAYESYTWRESQSRVVRDSAWFQRQAFWQAREVKQPLPDNVRRFHKG